MPAAAHALSVLSTDLDLVWAEVSMAIVSVAIVSMAVVSMAIVSMAILRMAIVSRAIVSRARRHRVDLLLPLPKVHCTLG